MKRFTITAAEKKLVLKKRQRMKADKNSAIEICGDLIDALSGAVDSKFFFDRGELEEAIQEIDSKDLEKLFYIADRHLDKAELCFKKLEKGLKKLG